MVYPNSNVKFETGHKFLFLEKDHGILSKEAKNRISIFNTSSERFLSKFSKLTNRTKLWLFKDALFNARSYNTCTCVYTSYTQIRM